MAQKDGPILESLKHLQRAHAARCDEVLHRHEREGLARATLLPGVRELLDTVDRRGIHMAVATRNSRAITAATLARFQLTFDPVLTRDDGPVKPDAWPVLHACQQWGLVPSQVVVVGDYKFDIESGRAAGARTVLLTHPQDPRQ